MWDFGGSEQYKEVYYYFPAVSSVHILVLNINSPHQDLFKWLIDIQCRRSSSVPVIVVFTHLDTINSRAERDQACHERLAWISEHVTGNCGAIMHKTDHSSFTNSLRTITDSQRRFDGSSYLFSAVCTHQTGSAAHLMPTIIAVTFVSNVTGNGIPQLRSRLYKTLTEPLPTLKHLLGPLGMGMNMPISYNELSQAVYNMRLQSQRPSNRGNEPFLYSIADLNKRILLQLKSRPACELLPVLKFMKQVNITKYLYVVNIISF